MDQQTRLKYSQETFTKYLCTMEGFFSKATNDLSIFLKPKLDRMKANTWDYDEKDIESLENHYYTELYELDAEFKYIFRKSFIVQIFSFLELELKSYCLRHFNEQKKEYSINDLRGYNELDKIEKYLKTSANQDITTNRELWDFICKIRIVRNLIVHHNGQISTKKGNEFSVIKKFATNNFSLYSSPPENNTFQIVFTEDVFVRDCISKIFDFLFEVTRHIDVNN